SSPPNRSSMPISGQGRCERRLFREGPGPARRCREAAPSTSWRDASVGLEPVRLIPVTPQVGEAYYQAENALQVLYLIEASEGGSNWLHWWRRWESNPRPEILGSRHLHQ